MDYYIDLPYFWSNINWWGKIKSVKIGGREKIKLASVYGKEYKTVVRRWVKLSIEMIVCY